MRQEANPCSLEDLSHWFTMVVCRIWRRGVVPSIALNTMVMVIRLLLFLGRIKGDCWKFMFKLSWGVHRRVRCMLETKVSSWRLMSIMCWMVIGNVTVSVVQGVPFATTTFIAEVPKFVIKFSSFIWVIWGLLQPSWNGPVPIGQIILPIVCWLMTGIVAGIGHEWFNNLLVCKEGSM